MRLRSLTVMMSIIGVLVVNAVVAQPSGKGLGVQGNPNKAQKIKPLPPRAAQRFTCINQRGETVSFVGSSSRIPPGLRCKATPPHGLQKKGKTPSGWEKGQKRGW